MSGFRPEVWVTSKELVSQESLSRMIEKLEGINPVRAYIQVVNRADSYYSSNILPPAEELVQDFDPLQMTIEKACGREFRISAWMNVNLVWGFGKQRPLSERHILNRRPEWVTVDENGTSMLEYPSSNLEEVFGPYIDPGIPEVREFTAHVASEISNYDVEEVHLDFIRYPFKSFGYNPIALAEYRKWLNQEKLIESKDSFDCFRIYFITSQVSMISEVVRAKGKKVSCAVYDDYSERALSERLQPWLEWLKSGLIDSAVVMAYGKEPDEVISRVEKIRSLHGSLKDIRIGLGAFNYAGRWDKFVELIKRVQKLRPDEITLFALSSVDEELRKRLRTL
ncbi:MULTISPECIES: glycoside hydrolase family 10 protein [unclassified Mesotoga]|uniref:glycoside hydrolase family 10 protein n=1 Tax=unclassified Mesotoga TaxID=1184398 RepID=UPI0021ACDC32|nr:MULTISPECIES: family 10 glycosylhydrolase [unclassified Mesotoga]